MDSSNIYYLIPIVAIAGGITYAILNSYWKSKSGHAAPSGTPELAAALTESTAANKALLEKLNSIDSRLAVVEKTLTDIP